MPEPGAAPARRAGRLLIAAPSLVDPNFNRAVLLMLEHGPEGALGVVLNRPTDLSARRALPGELGESFSESDVVHQGGPVQPDAVIVLADFTDPAAAASIAFDTVGVVDPQTSHAELSLRVRALRVYGGYAGWAAGQLEDEIAQEAWIDAAGQGEDVFTSEPERLWRRVLERKGGPYVLIARMPEDPSLN